MAFAVLAQYNPRTCMSHLSVGYLFHSLSGSLIKEGNFADL